MGKDRFEFARIASPLEIAEYLTSLASGLKRGEVALESDEETLRLTPGNEVKLAIKVKQRDSRGKIAIEVAWKREATGRTPGLQVQIPTRAR